MAFTDGADATGPNIDGSAGNDGGMAPSGPGPGAGGQQPGAPPPGGGPILASLARRMKGPQVSAPGPGDTASAMTMVTTAIGMLNQAIPSLPAGSPIYKDVLKAAQALSRHVGQTTPTAGVQATQIQDLLKNIVKNALLQRVMGQMKQVPGASGGDQPSAPSPLTGASAQAPMPSTPLPGA